MLDIQEFIAAYTEAALRSNFLQDIETADETKDRFKQDCLKFCQEKGHLFIGREQEAGYCFWFNRNRHGIGFSDEFWDEKIGNVLTESSHSFGEVELYLGDDGLIYAI